MCAGVLTKTDEKLIGRGKVNVFVSNPHSSEAYVAIISLTRYRSHFP